MRGLRREDGKRRRLRRDERAKEESMRPKKCFLVVPYLFIQCIYTRYSPLLFPGNFDHGGFFVREINLVQSITRPGRNSSENPVSSHRTSCVGNVWLDAEYLVARLNTRGGEFSMAGSFVER